MNIYELITNAYPLATKDIINGKISLRNDSDGYGDYIESWDVDYAVPEGLSVGKIKEVT